MWDTHLVVAALRADRADVESYARVLSHVLGDALPPGMVEVERRRGLFGRGGEPVAVRVHGQDRLLELRAGKRGGVEAEAHQVVRGVVISRRAVTVEQWLELLAAELTGLAERDAAASAALGRLLNQ
ncbi:hypothetical protein [Kutzneria albida]|uniref:Uncharacterized protein n=1 Tax=Kutzneria albida DSM 43870 TaxID=1449976 RepID=W5WHX8_9PSEU|nr:hypothetical protein [Kutzneria albida]AHI00804.1 hypothetical protein KALB_7446 [Kutzneria albida DSM 43870]